MSARKRGRKPSPEQQEDPEAIETSETEELANEPVLSPEVLAPEDDVEAPESDSAMPVVHPAGEQGTVSALTRYMAQLRHHAPISREEEHALAAYFSIRSIPSVMVFREQVLLYNEPGAMDESAIRQLLSYIKELDMNQVRHEVAEATGDVLYN